MPRPVSEQVIVITGASSGIGLATAFTGAHRGAKVVLAARNAADLDSAAETIRRAGGEALAVPTDVTSYEQVRALAAQTVEAFGRIDTWVNNAAVSAYAPFTELSLEDVRQLMDINFMGQLHGAKAALPHLERSAGALICVGSTLSDRGVPLQSIYCASKHAVKGWIDSLRVELREAGSRVRVTLIKPSSINTPLFNKTKTQLGVMPQPIPPVYEPELAAEAILRAAQGNERDVFVGGAGKALSAAERISPKLVDVHQRYRGFDAQKTTWPEASDSPNNLYGPVAWDGGVRGDFTDGAHRRSTYQRIDAHVVTSSVVASAALAMGASVLRRNREGGGLAALMTVGAVAFAGKALVAVIVQR
jgi:NAD(P)-dependent dehydrogenase (short-subunit alcohol dehydrogenase family)